MGPLIPAIPAIGSTIAGLFAGRGKNKANQITPEERAALSTQNQISNESLRQGRLLFPYAQNFLDRASSGFSPLLSYYSSMLGGNRQAMTQQLAPEIETLRNNYSNSFRALNEFSPRSGGSAAYNTELATTRLPADISSAFFGLRPSAATNYGSLITNMAQLGTGVAGAGSSLLGGASSGAGNLLQYGLGSRNIQLGAQRNDFLSGQAFGQGISGILGSIDWAKILPKSWVKWGSGGAEGGG